MYSLFKFDKIKINKYSCYAILFIFSAVFCYFFSIETSGRYHDFYECDSQTFEVIGKAWSLGKIPYISYWDSKGPVIFFVNMLGFLIFKNVKGVLVLEIISFFVTLFFIFKTLNLKYNNFVCLISTCVFSLFFTCTNWWYGNTVSEWCLPFLSVSAFLIYKYFLSNKKEHPAFYSFFYGITFGICAMSRLTNAIIICFFITEIIFILLKNKKIKNLLLNFLFGFLGIACIIMPFSVYFSLKGAFNEMIYATFIYNFKYCISSAKSFSLFYFMCNLLIFYLLFVSFLQLKNNKKLLFIILPVFCSLIFFIFSRCYPHYFLIFLPFSFLLLSEICEFKTNNILNFVLLIFIAATLSFTFFKFYGECINNRTEYVKIHDNLFEQVPEEYKDKTLEVDTIFNGLYTRNDFLPDNKYFDFQTNYAILSEKTKEDILKDFALNEPKYIIIENAEHSVYKEYIEKNYILIDEILYEQSQGLVKIPDEEKTRIIALYKKK